MNTIKKLYLMTDLEGVAGMLDFGDWCRPGNRYYEVAKEFLTNEVNAAVAGFFEGGVKEIVVADGHGSGAINIGRLDPRVEYLRGWEKWPLLLDDSFDAVGWVGQHAKAGAPYAHLAHTQDPCYLDLSVNGISIGELGQFAMCASELGVRSIFAAGDLALTEEARVLLPGIETVSVKRGTIAGSGDECPEEVYMERNHAAIHVPPARACALIRAGARKAAERSGREDFGLIPMKPPFALEAIFRSNAREPRRIYRCSHPTSFIQLMNIPLTDPSVT